ncbi:MAG: hypothetical protein ABI131_05925 [Nostocoides sp.]
MLGGRVEPLVDIGGSVVLLDGEVVEVDELFEVAVDESLVDGLGSAGAVVSVEVGGSSAAAPGANTKTDAMHAETAAAETVAHPLRLTVSTLSAPTPGPGPRPRS